MKRRQPEKHRKDASWFAAWLLGIFSLAYAISVATLLARNASISRAGAFLAALAAIVYFGTALVSSSLTRRTMLSTFFALVVGVYAAEVFLFTQSSDSAFAKAAKRQGLPFDMRQRPELLKDLRRSGPVTTSYGPDQMIGVLGTTEKSFFPLSGISNITTVYCNELGNYLIYQSDEHGFNNPPGPYTADALDFVTIGDSFVLGGCVKPEQNVTSQLRARGFHDLSLGVVGTGPLVDLAVLQEYATRLRPRNVLWFYTEGDDREGFAREMESRLLTSYFDRSFSQGLFNRQPEIDALIRSLERQALAEKLDGKPPGLESNVIDILTLRDLRYTVASAINKPVNPDIPDTALATSTDAMLERTFKEAKERVESWGGRLWVVYLPDQRRYAFAGPVPADLFSRDSTLRMLKRQDIPVIDFKTKMDTMADPLSFYPFRQPRSHYTPEGYASLADLIAARLRSGK
jgi:hypothetical protein